MLAGTAPGFEDAGAILAREFDRKSRDAFAEAGP
jgi:hypothetical protein